MRRMKNIYKKENQREATVQSSISNTVAHTIIFKPDARLQKLRERGMAWVKSSHWEKKGSLVEMCSELSSMRKWQPRSCQVRSEAGAFDYLCVCFTLHQT